MRRGPADPAKTTAFVALVLLLAGCGSDGGFGDNGRPVATLRDSAGVVLVENHSGDSRSPAPWRAEQAWVLAGEEGREETHFGFVADVAIDGDTLYVLDQHAQQVRLFAPDGRLVRTIGRAGEGPGELSRFATSLLLRDDTLLVADWGRGRMHRFRKDGTFIDALLFPGAGSRSWWRVAGDGQLYYRALARVTDDAGRWLGRDHLLRVGAEWDAPDTVYTFTYGQTDLGARGAPKLPLVVNTPTWDVMADGRIVWTTLERADVRIQGPDGGLERVVTSDRWVARPPGAAARDRLMSLMREKMVMLGGSAETVDQLEVIAPEVMPVLSSVRAGPEGTIWVQRVAGADPVHPMALNTPDPPTGWGGAEWDVLDGEGRFLGTVVLSPRTRVTRILDDRVVGVSRDGMDRDEVVVWRLVR